MIKLVQFLGLCISLSLFSCSSSKHVTIQSENSFHKFNKSGNDYIVVNNVGGHATGGHGEIFSIEKLFTTRLPNDITKSSLALGRSFIHQFWYRDKSVFMVIDRKYPIDIRREDSISRTEFLKIIDTIKDFRSPFAIANDKMLKKNRYFGIASKGTFILCYMKVTKQNVAKFKRAINSFSAINQD